MSNTEKIWIIAGIATFAGTLGLLVGLREIVHRVNSIPVHNRLTRSHGDIELGNYIEPVQPPHSYQPIDLVNLNYEPYNWADRVPSYYTGPAPSYYSGGNPPSFNTVDRIYINSSLEDSINLDYILWLILFCVSLLMLRKLIISILVYNSRNILISSAFMTPLSISRISYINDLDIPAFNDFESEKIEIFRKFTIKETSDFLNKLEDNESFIIDIGFIPNIALWDLDAPQMSLSKPILINRNSSPTTINKFILERLDYMVDYYYLDDTILQKESDSAVLLTYCKLKSI